MFEIGIIETFQDVFDATKSFDGIIQAVEVEAIAENSLSIIHNQKQTYTAMQTQARQTRQTVETTAG